MSEMYDKGYDLFEREPGLTVDELIARSNALPVSPRMQDEFYNGYWAANLDERSKTWRFK